MPSARFVKGATAVWRQCGASQNLLRNAGHTIRIPLRAVSNDWTVTPSLLPSQPLGFQFLHSRSGVFATQRLVALPVFHCSLILTAVPYAQLRRGETSQVRQ